MIKLSSLLVSFAIALSSVMFVGLTSAHVTIDPKEAVPGFQRYAIIVPTEKEIPTTELRLVVPDGMDITGVLPVSGWTHRETKVPVQSPGEQAGHGEDSERITEITWSGGRINPGEYQIFGISTRYQGDPKEFAWKAYQKYADGSVVSWDSSDEQHPAPKITILNAPKIDTLTNSVNEVKTKVEESAGSETSLWISLGALLVSIAAMLVNRKR